MILAKVHISEDDFEELEELYRRLAETGAHPALVRLLQEIIFWKEEA